MSVKVRPQLLAVLHATNGREHVPSACSICDTQARPIPLEAPVTTTVFLVIASMQFFLSWPFRLVMPFVSFGTPLGAPPKFRRKSEQQDAHSASTIITIVPLVPYHTNSAFPFALRQLLEATLRTVLEMSSLGLQGAIRAQDVRSRARRSQSGAHAITFRPQRFRDQLARAVQAAPDLGQ